MFGLTAALQYYLYNSPTDMRKSFDGLCNVIQGRMMRNPVSGEVFIFINKRRDLMKILHWEYGGFVLYYKRLESGTFELPLHQSADNSTVVHWPELMMMVEGISLQFVKIRKRYLLTASG
jgi:transposase